MDFTDRISLQEKDRLQALLGDQVVLAPNFATAMFAYNFTKPPFANNPKLRLAMNMAIDRDVLVKYVQRGVGIPAYNVMPPLPGYEQGVPDWAKLSNEERHAMARNLYQEAGYSESHPLETMLTYATGGSDDRRFMEALSAMWLENLGAKVQIYNVEWKVLLAQRQLHQPVLFWSAWIGDFPDPYTFMQIFQTGFGNNDGVYSNPKFDALVEQAGNTSDQAERYKLFHEAEEVLNEDAPVLTMYFYESNHLIKPYIKGWKSNIADRHLSRYMYVLAHQES
jgi:oligopeptide transport system substrate-binding protein